MKLHLPYQLYRVLLAVFVGIPALTPFAIAEDLIYKEQESALYGGAICNNQISRPYLAEEYDTVLFDTNRAARSGGAIYNVGTMSLSENGSITFLNNTTGGMGYTGGAIYNKGSFVMSGNTGEILFEGDKAALEQGPGCAVYNEGAFTMNMADNKNIRFTQNSATRGGAIAYKEGTQGILTLGQNSLVTFSGNTASEVGGAIAGFISSNSLSVCSMRLVGNESVVFELNVAGTYGGAIANYYYTSSSPDKNLNNSSNNEQVRFFGNRAKHGGAIANYFNAIPPGSSGNITMSGNGKVLFENNCATEKGGAIYNKGLSGGSAAIVTIADNKHVLFSGNYEKSSSGEYRLRSVYVEGGALNLSAQEGGSIEFRDALYADKDSSLSFNAAYEGKAQTGDIIFTGQYAEDALNQLYGQDGKVASAAEVAASQTSTIKCDATLRNGRLIIREGAAYAGKGLAVEGGSLLLQEGSMELTGTLDFAQGTSLSVADANTIEASTLTFGEGGSFDVKVSRTHTGAAALTLEGDLAFSSNSWTISLSSNGMGNGKYALLKVDGTLQQDGSTVADASWLGSVEVDKTGLGDIWAKHADVTWDAADATLYLTVNYALDWTNATRNGLWDTTEENWADAGEPSGYTDGVLVVFGDEGAGKVTLSGNLAPGDVVVDNSEGHDYIWNPDAVEGGSLTGGMALEKSGDGKLTINTANNYTGGTTIKGGTLVAGTATALGSGHVTLSGGTLEIAADGFSNALSAERESTLAVAGGYALVLTEALDNKGTLTLSGTLDASALESVAMEATRIDTEGRSGSNGFDRSAGLSITLASGSTKDGGGPLSCMGRMNMPCKRMARRPWVVRWIMPPTT